MLPLLGVAVAHKTALGFIKRLGRRETVEIAKRENHTRNGRDDDFDSQLFKQAACIIAALAAALFRLRGRGGGRDRVHELPELLPEL